MKIVKFGNGKYGIRKYRPWWFSDYYFVDLISTQFAWSMDSGYFFNSCMGTKKQVEEIYSGFNHKAVKIVDTEESDEDTDKETIMKDWERLSSLAGKELEQVLNECLNAAMCQPGRIKHPNSNAIAKFVESWCDSNGVY